LPLLSFFNAHDSQVWSFDGISEFLHIVSQLLSSLTKSFSVFSLISILSLNSEILSSSCSSLLEWPSTEFFFD
jgi:plasmid replication initiation protein